MTNLIQVPLIQVPTCFKSPQSNSIDLMLSNSKVKIFDCGSLETGMIDHHLMIYGIFKNFSSYDIGNFSFDVLNSQLSGTLSAESFFD